MMRGGTRRETVYNLGDLRGTSALCGLAVMMMRDATEMVWMIPERVRQAMGE